MTSKSSLSLDFSGLTEFFRSASAMMEQALPEYLPLEEPREFLYDLARDYPARGGKRFRPALLLLCTSIAGGETRLALPSAVALELFHNFALVHDDIEDDSLFRRGAPTLHHTHGIPLALNAGDLLLSLTHEALLANEPLLGAVRTLEVQRSFAEIFRRTFEGQAMDIGWCQGKSFPTREEYQTMIRLKTGWYSGRGPCEIGAVIGGAPPELVSALGNYGEKMGIGFQMHDDVLNLTTDSADQAPGVNQGGYGKERGGDIAEGKRTLITIETLERVSPAEAKKLKAILLKTPTDTSQEEIEWAIGLAESTGALDAVGEYCRSLAEEALTALDSLPPSQQLKLLREIVRFLTQNRQT